MNDDDTQMVPLATRDDERGAPFDTPAQGRLLAEAIGLARSGCTQDAIADTLRQRYPGLPNDRYYGNPAAEATMREVRKGERSRDAYKADIARLQAKGLPLTLAKGGDPDAIEPRPDYTDSDDDPDWHGPLHTEVQACRTPGDLLDLCTRYGLTFAVVGEDWRLSRRIAADSDLFTALRVHKTRLIAILRERDEPLGTYS